jgi:hypothetical protein
MRKAATAIGAVALALAAGCGTRPPPRDFAKENADRWRAELARWGGAYAAWEERVRPFHDDVRRALADRPKEIAGIVGLDGFLFFRRSLEVLVAGDLREQEKPGRDPYPAVVDYHGRLKARGIDLLFCPIPVKAAVMPAKMSENAPPAEGPYVDPWTRKLMAELADAGVECVDLLPAFLEERDGAGEPFYMPLDTHWSHRALRIAARLFAERVRAYPWYDEVAKEQVAYSTKHCTFKRRGDIVPMLPEAERLSCPPMELGAEQVVRPDGSFYKDEKSSPILFLGDSYSAVFHFQDCKHAGITAHIAKETGVPVDLVLGLGMGPEVRKKLLRRGKGGLDGKRLVIWALSERDLHNYRSPWEKIPLPE